MVNEYKWTVLLKGLTLIRDKHFCLFKSLMASDLRLERSMQEQYTRDQIADMMEDEFPDDAGLDKLIKFCEDIPALKKRAEILKKERSEVIRKTSLKITKQEAGPATPTSTISHMFASERGKTSTALAETSTAQVESSAAQKKRKQITKTEGGKKKKLTKEQASLPETSRTNIKKDEDCLQTPLKSPPTPPSSSSNKKQKNTIIRKHSITKTEGPQEKQRLGEFSSTNNFPATPKRGTVPKEPAKEEGYQKGPKQVMVLKVTEPFTYDMIEDKRMFHATVATETEFFRVKVFDTALKSKFIPRNIIAISDYFGHNGFLEIYRASCVSDVNVNQTMVISNTLRQRANATPKISYLFSQAKGTFVNGDFVVFKKTVRNEFICYGIEDDTGKMEVLVYGQLTNIRCEPGSKLRLVCFELTSTVDAWQLRSVKHSYMQVINS